MNLYGVGFSFIILILSYINEIYYRKMNDIKGFSEGVEGVELVKCGNIKFDIMYNIYCGDNL